MLNIIKNETIFPEYIKLNICLNLVDEINNIISPYKSNVNDAVIYSLSEKKTVKSERRKSSKISFHSNELRKLINTNICNLINSKLKYEYPHAHFNVSIGEQIFDYIKYDNGGYFDIHKDFVRINNNNQCQYTLLMGLTDKKDVGSHGNTIIWIPVSSINQCDYNILINATTFTKNLSQRLRVDKELFSEEWRSYENTDDIIIVAKKYNLPYCGDITYLTNLFEINTSEKKYIPSRLNSYQKGNALLFKSDMLHSGESFYDWYKAKELFGLTINITGSEHNNLTSDYGTLSPLTTHNISDNSDKSDKSSLDIINLWLNDKNDKIIKFNKFENWMCDFVKQNKILPFQIIISSGTYNNKNFSDTYLKYINLDDSLNIETLKNISGTNTTENLLEKINKTLIEIYTKTKDKLNTRGRESHIDSEISNITENIEQIQSLNGIIFNLSHIVDTIDTIDTTDTTDTIDTLKFNNISFDIQNYFLNWTHSNNSIITRTEEILNTWEESSCNDDGDEYTETTYLNCNIDIKFCFYKLSK